MNFIPNFFHAPLSSKQIHKAICTGQIHRSLKQKLIGFFSSKAIEQVLILEKNLSNCTTFLKRSYACAQATKNPELKYALSLAFHKETRNQIDLFLTIKGQQFLIQEAFLTPTNDQNQGFTFDKFKYLIEHTNHEVLLYSESMLKLNIYDLKRIEFISKDNNSINLYNILSNKEQYKEFLLKNEKKLIIDYNGELDDILKIKILHNTGYVLESLVLIKIEEKSYLIESQDKIGDTLPNFSIFSNLTYSYGDVQNFIIEQQDSIKNFLAQENINEQLEFRYQLGLVEQKIIIQKIQNQKEKIKIIILPPGQKRITLYHIPSSASREYRYGGLECVSDFQKLSYIKQISRKKPRSLGCENDSDTQLKSVTFQNKDKTKAKEYKITEHFVGDTLYNYLKKSKKHPWSDAWNFNLKRTFLHLISDYIEKKGMLFIDFNLENILINKFGTMIIVDGLIPINKADIKHINSVITTINQRLNLDLPNFENKHKKENLAFELAYRLKAAHIKDWSQEYINTRYSLSSWERIGIAY